MKTIGIVGWSPFNELMAKYLAPYSEQILVASRKHDSGRAGEHAVFAPAEQVLACDVVIPAIPSQFLPDYLQDNAKHIRPDALVIDVCSVKQRPVQTMLKYLPDTVSILATHPLFGPGSANGGIAGHRIMLHPVRISNGEYQKAKAFLGETLGLKVIETTPEEHDKAIAYVLGLTQSLGRATQDLDIPDTPLGTTAYDDLLDMKRIQGNDSWELYRSIMQQNPYARDVLDDLIKSLQNLRGSIS
jgi:prephenate dehydrogenase